MAVGWFALTELVRSPRVQIQPPLRTLVFISRFGVTKTLKAVLTDQNHHGHVFKKSMNFKEFGVIKDHFYESEAHHVSLEQSPPKICDLDRNESAHLPFFPPRLCKSSLLFPATPPSRGEAKRDAKSCVTRAAIHQLHSHSRRLRFRGVGHEMKTYGKSHLCCGDRTEEMRDCCRASVEGTKPWKKLLLFSPGYFSQQQGGREQRMFLSEEFFF